MPNMRLSLKAINDELQRLGSSAVLTKGEGYFYFQGGEATDWLDRSIRVATLHSLTLDQWMEQYRKLKAKNDALVKGNIASKDIAAHSSGPVASNPEENRQKTPNPGVGQGATWKRSGGRVPPKQQVKSELEPHLRLHHVPIFVRDRSEAYDSIWTNLDFVWSLTTVTVSVAASSLLPHPMARRCLRSLLPSPTLRNID
jgi:hypothetical protein